MSTTFASEEQTTQDIQLKESTIPSTPVRPRSELPRTTAWVDTTVSNVVVAFEEEVGTVVVEITDETGSVQSRQTVNSGTVQLVNLPMPNAGAYQLTIAGNEYQAEGNFVIE